MNVHASIPIPYTPVPIHTHTYTRIHAPRGIVYTPVYTSSSTGLNTKHSSRLITLQPPIKQQRLRTVTINDNGRLNGGNGAPRMKRSGDMISRSFSAIINALCLYEPHFSPSLPLSLSLSSPSVYPLIRWRSEARVAGRHGVQPGHHKSRAIIVSVFS